MFWNFLKGGPKRFLGVDIGTSNIRVVELKRGNPPELENYGELEISSGKVGGSKNFRVFKENSLLLSDKEVSETIKNICSEAEIGTKEANFSIPDFSSFFTTLDLPLMGKDELYEAVRYESRPYIPLPDKEITLDWVITEGELSKTPIRVLVVAIPNDVVSQYQKIADHSGLELRLLEPEVFSLARNLKGEKKNLGVIDIGARSTTCSILEKGALKISHSFNIGGNQLTETLARSLDIDYNRAKGLKEAQGIASQQEKEREILLPSIDSILDEIKKAFREFYQKEGKEIEKVVLTGGVAKMPGLKDYFSSELKKEIAVLNPFSGLFYPDVLNQTLAEKASLYGVAVGAALKGFE